MDTSILVNQLLLLRVERVRVVRVEGGPVGIKERPVE
jgi:hypothetical protein